MAKVPSDIEIAQQRALKPVDEVAAGLGLGPDDLKRHGDAQAKVKMDTVSRLLAGDTHEAPLVLVSAITQTDAGAGKTTCSIGLSQALQALGHRASVTLREPSMGPVFGRKGGAAGGGYSQLLPMEEINLHFTGDMHAITSANNLIAAALDNELYFENQPQLRSDQVLWRRCMDMNDRALRRFTIGPGHETEAPAFERAFDITAGSAVMAMLCLERSYGELKEKIGEALLTFDSSGKPFTARQLGVHGAATAVLKQALEPNLVQTYEHTPAFVHGGPFANIAQGTCSALSMRLARKLSDYVVTEAGFGFDLGGEKFFDLVGPYAGLSPSVVVLVATVKSLKQQGGAATDNLESENVEAVHHGAPNLHKHIENVRKFGVEPIVAINRFPTDTQQEIEAVQQICDQVKITASVVNYYGQGGEGGLELAEQVVAAVDRFNQSNEAGPGPIYDWQQKPTEKIATIARELYGAQDVAYSETAQADLEMIEKLDADKLPICMAKTPKSLSDKEHLLGRPEGFTLDVRNIMISTGGGFLIPMTGPILRMPGLPSHPSALDIDIDDDGTIAGLG